jgi:hypothetical protein
MRQLLFIGILLLIGGCAAPAPSDSPTQGFVDQVPQTPDLVPGSDSSPSVTPSPLSPTQELPTDTPEPSYSPTSEPLPTLEPTYLSFLTLTPSSTPGPETADIQIFSPGPLSKVASPFELRAYLMPYAFGTVRVELVGEDGRLLSREGISAADFWGQFGRLVTDVPFEIKGAAEMGRLQISTLDEHKRVIALKSVSLMLLADGLDIMNPPAYLDENVLIDLPEIKGFASGGEVRVVGKMQVFNDLPVLVELVNLRGRVLSTRVISIGPADGKFHSFETIIPYNIDSYEPDVLLVIRQDDNRIQGPFYLYSQLINLNP